MVPFAALACLAGCISHGHAQREVESSVAKGGVIDVSSSVRLYYQMVGAGPDTIVAVHGGPTFGLHDLMPDLDWLGRDHVVIYYDLRGTGRSSLPSDTAQLTMQDHVADLAALIAHFHLSRPTLVGHSWGAVVSLIYASGHPRVARLLLLEPMAAHQAPYDAQYARQLARRATPADSATLRAARSPAYLAAHPIEACRAIQGVFLRLSVGADSLASHVRADWCAMPPESFTYAMRYTGPVGNASVAGIDFRDAGVRVTMPVLVVAGSNDPLPWESAAEWVRILPNARLLLIDGAGHYAHAERADQFQTPAAIFLEGRWPSTARAAP